MLKASIANVVVFFLIVSSLIVHGQEEYEVEAIDAAPQSESVSADLAQRFADKGYRVKIGSSRTVCEIWLTKQWDIDSSFKASEQRLYPFFPGQLVGLLHFSRKGSEFREQAVPSGWYTLRFALQPVDGNHEGTSITRDFLLMIGTERDEAEKKWEPKSLFGASAESIGATHPAMLSLQRASDGTETSIRHDKEKDWRILHLVGNGIAGAKSQIVPLELVIAGHAAE